MKKIIFTAAAVMALACANAQATKSIKFGVKGGLNVTTLSGDIEEAEAKIGGHVGGFAEFRCNKFAIQPELLLSMQGAESNYTNYFGGDFYSSRYEANLLYLNVPVMAKYYILPKLSAEFGPQIGILLDAETKYSETINGDVQYSENENVRSDIKTIDVGLNLGASYNFNDHIGVGVRYTMGLTNIDDSKPAPFEPKADVKNQVFTASFAYRF
jgi:outer membrane protein W